MYKTMKRSKYTLNTFPRWGKYDKNSCRKLNCNCEIRSLTILWPDVFYTINITFEDLKTVRDLNRV